MLWGDSPAQGFIRGQTFAHPDLGFLFTAPRGFTLMNGERQVIARGPGGAAIVFDAAPPGGAASMTDYIRGVWAPQSPLQGLEPLTINGMPAASALTRGSLNGGAVDVRLFAVRFAPDRVHRFVFVAPAGRMGALDAAFRQTAGSFRRLTPAEAAQLQPRRVRVVTVQPGDTVARFVAMMPQEAYAEELFRIINDIPPGTPLEPGRRVKVVTGG